MANSKLLRGGWHVCFYLCCRSKPFRLLPGDIAKLQFTLDAVNKPDPFIVESEIPTEVQKALEWISENDPEQIRQEPKLSRKRLKQEHDDCGSFMCFVVVCCATSLFSAPLHPQV